MMVFFFFYNVTNKIFNIKKKKKRLYQKSLDKIFYLQYFRLIYIDIDIISKNYFKKYFS